MNTGWTGGPYGVGHRMSIAHTRAMVNAAIEGRIPNDYETEPFFGLMIPKHVPDVPIDVLNPRNAWSDRAAYDEQARKLAQLFFDNFKRFEAHVSPGDQRGRDQAVAALRSAFRDSITSTVACARSRQSNRFTTG